MLARIWWYLDPLFPHQLRKNVAKVGPPLTKLSGSAHANLYLLLCIGSLDVRKEENKGSNMIAFHFEIYMLEYYNCV